MLALDSHAHCGLTLPFKILRPYWDRGKIEGGVLFSPVEEIYDRCDSRFTDSESYKASRKKVHAYLKDLVSGFIFAYWFVWNDFMPPEEDFCGVKWHRHPYEPRYNYEAEECEAFLKNICDLKLPVIIEEEFENTLMLVNRVYGRTPVIIPHLGALNGGYELLKRAGLFENKLVYADTALAGTYEMEDFAGEYGIERLMFGSDFPFGEPSYERYKVEQVFYGRDREKVLSANLLALLGQS